MEGHSIAQRLGAEFIGTALLVFVGAGSVPAILVLESGTEAPFTASIGTSGPATCATRPAKPCAIASLWETERARPEQHLRRCRPQCQPPWRRQGDSVR